MGVPINVQDNGGYIVRELSYPVFRIVDFEFLGINTLIPDVYHDVLVCDYGITYMIPDPNYVPRKRENLKYLNDKLGVVTYFNG